MTNGRICLTGSLVLHINICAFVCLHQHIGQSNTMDENPPHFKSVSHLFFFAHSKCYGTHFKYVKFKLALSIHYFNCEQKMTYIWKNLVVSLISSSV